MTDRRSESPTKDTSPLADENEIDLRQIIGVLVAWRREIIALGLVAAICAVVVFTVKNSTSRPVYEAAATVAIARVESNVSFDPKFKTDAQQTQMTDLRARRAALLGLASNGTVAASVVKQLGDKLSAQEQNPSRLMESVRAVISSDSNKTGVPTTSDLNSDLIQIVARADEPEKAAAIANTWAKAYVDQVNAIYGQVSSDVSPSVEAQLAKAQADYQTSQHNLQVFLAGSKIDETKQEITSAQVQIANAYDGYATTARLLNSARAMRAQVAAGGEGAAASNAAALQVLKVQVFAQLDSNHPFSDWQSDSRPEEPVRQNQDQARRSQPATSLQLQLPALSQLSAGSMLADLDGLIQALENSRREMAGQISALSAALLAKSASTTGAGQADPAGGSQSLSDAIGALQSRLRELDTQLEAENARQQELTQARDLAWDTYKTLNSKVAELKVAQAAANTEVRFAAPALPPARPLGRRSLAFMAVLAGVTGLVLAACLALMAHYLGSEPFLARSSKGSKRLGAAI